MPAIFIRNFARMALGALFISSIVLVAIDIEIERSPGLSMLLGLCYLAVAILDRNWTAFASVAVGTLELALVLPGRGFAVSDPQDALALLFSVVLGLTAVTFARSERATVLRLRRELDETSRERRAATDLLKELSHRLSNDLTMLISHAGIAGRRTMNLELRNVLADLNVRIVALGRIYRRFRLEEQGEAGVAMPAYLSELCDDLRLYRFDTPAVTVRLAVEELHLPVRCAALLGIITNELLTNVYKHAFPDDRNGVAVVALRRHPTRSAMLVLEVSDNGVGFIRKTSDGNHIGQRLLASLANQLDGDISFARLDGRTVASLNFPHEELPPSRRISPIQVHPL